MDTRRPDPELDRGVTRRDFVAGGLAGGAALSVGPLLSPSPLRAQAKRGGILRVRGYAPPHLDPHTTLNFKTNTTLSFVHAKLVRHKVGSAVKPGTFAIEPDLAERWEEPDDTTVVFHLRKGVRWQNRPPVNGRELTAEDVKFTFDRFLTEKGNPLRFMLDPVDRVEVADRYTVRFRLKEPFVWLVQMLANPTGTWIVPREVVEKHGDLKKPETAIGAGPFILDRYEPNVRAVFKRNPDYYQPSLPSVDGVDWTVMEDEAAGLSPYRAGQIVYGARPCCDRRHSGLDAPRISQPALNYQQRTSHLT